MDADVGGEQALKGVKLGGGSALAVRAVGDEDEMPIFDRSAEHKVGRHRDRVDKGRPPTEAGLAGDGGECLRAVGGPFVDDLWPVAVLHNGHRVARGECKRDGAGDGARFVEALDRAELAAGVHDDQHVCGQTPDAGRLVQAVVLSDDEVICRDAAKELAVFVKGEHV